MREIEYTILLGLVDRGLREQLQSTMVTLWSKPTKRFERQYLVLSRPIPSFLTLASSKRPLTDLPKLQHTFTSIYAWLTAIDRLCSPGCTIHWLVVLIKFWGSAAPTVRQ